MLTCFWNTSSDVARDRGWDTDNYKTQGRYIVMYISAQKEDVYETTSITGEGFKTYLGAKVARALLLVLATDLNLVC